MVTLRALIRTSIFWLFKLGFKVMAFLTNERRELFATAQSEIRNLAFRTFLFYVDIKYHSWLRE